MPLDESSLDAAKALLSRAPDVWDMTVPWVRMYWDIEVLRRYRAAGYTFASLTIQDMPASFDGVQVEQAAFVALCESEADWLTFAFDLEAIDKAKALGKLVIGFNVQDTRLVHDDLGRLQTLYDHGVRHMLLAYQLRNLAADGCAEPADAGLSLFGRTLVREMNRVGMVVDVSHTGKRSSLDAMSASDAPVIFSHSGASAVCRHIRNIDDEQIRACAATGGAIGIVGIGPFLGDPEAKSESVFRHLDHLVQLVGPQYAGIGTDFIDDLAPAMAGIRSEREGAWRDPYGTQLYDGVAFAPEQLVELVGLMVRAGYDEEAIFGILGGNFRRIYAAAESRHRSFLKEAA